MTFLKANNKTSIFALGCFRSVQDFFDKTDWVIETTVGYSWGTWENPTYRNILDHSESIKIVYDTQKISYEKLLQLFIEKRDPTLPYYKEQYKSIIFYTDETEKLLAERILEQEAPKHNRPITVSIQKVWDFYDAEKYHQKYNEKARAKRWN